MLVDKAQALRMHNGDTEFLTEIWKLFLDDARSKLDKLDQAFAEQDVAQLERLAHSLKSSSAVIGSSVLSEKAAHLEMVSRDGNSEEVRTSYPEFRGTLDGVLEFLADELGQQ
jgi:HPt (histidine-containing phosphotransfer) domain-containing protein